MIREEKRSLDVSDEKESKISDLRIRPFGNMPIEEIFAAFKVHTAAKPFIFDVEPKAYGSDQAAEPFTQPLFSETPVLTKFDIRQGQLGDCYFLATVAAILQQPNGPQMIAGCMRDLSEPIEKDGKWTTLGKALGLKDDQKILVRLFGASGAVAYALVDKSEIVSGHRAQSPVYIQILEKAYAGLFKEQDMRHLESGLPQYVIGSFLGEETRIRVKKVAKTPAKELSEMLSSNGLMVVSTKHQIGESSSVGVAGEQIVSGLAAAHAYTVVNSMPKVFTAKILGKEYRQEHAGVNLFNPWGYDEESKSEVISGMHWQLEMKRQPGSVLPRLSLEASPSGTENANSWVPMKLVQDKMLELCCASYDSEKDYTRQLSASAIRAVRAEGTPSLTMEEPSLMDKGLELSRVEAPRRSAPLSASGSVMLFKSGQGVVEKPMAVEPSVPQVLAMG